MKKVLIIALLIIVSGCTIDYKEIKPEIATPGTITMIDSAQWTPVLMQVNGDQLIILDKGDIRKINIVDEVVYFVIFILCAILFFAVLIIFSNN